jgi:hypothetical protein
VVFRYNGIPFVCDKSLVRQWLSTMTKLFTLKQEEDVFHVPGM